jgi:peroxisomal 2,4-dienoyl-CoA reductase
VLDIDAVGTFNFSRAAFPLLRAPPGGAAGGAGSGGDTADCGVVINVSATLHYGATWFQAHACAAKAAVDALTRALALEWGALGVRVVGVAPGPIAGTAGMAKLAPGGGGARAAALAAEVPLGRLGAPRDIGWACVFLASRGASYVTGETLVVDGGAWLARPQLVPRAQVARASRAVEGASRAVGLPASRAPAKL